MTTLMRIDLSCPCCKSTFESESLGSTNTYGKKTDFHPLTSGTSPLPLYIHTCPTCGYSGFPNDFDDTVNLSATTKELIEQRLKPLVRDEQAFPGRRYEYAGWIREWRGEPPQDVAQMYLMAAWCCDDDGRGEDEMYYRRQALERFESALQQSRVPKPELPVVTYLIGELYRRVGEPENAARWFDRVAEAAVGRDDLAWLVQQAQKQKTDPDETF